MINNKNNNKPWFTKECNKIRKEFNKARDVYKKVKNEVNKNSLNNKAKEYKTVLNKNYFQYQKKCEDEIRRASKSDSKGLWKILNKFSGNFKENPDVDLQTLFDYFKELNAEIHADDVVGPTNIANNNISTVCEALLNSEITEAEIKEAIQSLKNNKASGIDGIANEYLKVTSPVIISIYCKIFNLVFDSGIVP